MARESPKPQGPRPARSRDAGRRCDVQKRQSQRTPARSCRWPARSAAIHQVEELVAIEQIHSRTFLRFPAAQLELDGSLWFLPGQSLPEELVGHILKRPAFVRGLLLDALQEIIIDCHCSSCHAQKCMAHASRCQPG